jgi:inositol transport system substrate-binding protein
MKKKVNITRRVTAGMSATFLALTLAACGGSSNASTSSASAASSTSSTAASSTAASSTATSSVATTSTASSSATATKDVKDIRVLWADGNLANESNAVCTGIAADYAKEKGITLDFTDAQGQGDKQVSQIETAIQQDYDCIIIQPYDAAACQTAAEECIEAGVPVLVTKGEIEDQSVCPFIGQNDTDAGEMEMQWMADKIGGKGNIVVIEGPTGISAAILRSDGINNVLKNYPDIHIIYQQTGNWNRDEGMSLMETWLQTGEEIDGVVAHNDEMALGALDAIKDAGKQDEIPVVGIDGIDAALQSVKDGELGATILQDVDSVAKKTIDVAILASQGEKVDSVYYIQPVEINPDNVDDYLK